MALLYQVSHRAALSAHSRDTFVETTLLPTDTREEVRNEHQEYRRLIARSHDHRRRGKLAKAKKGRQRAQQFPSMDVFDPGSRRLRYVQHTDDVLPGLIGPRSNAEETRQVSARGTHPGPFNGQNPGHTCKDGSSKVPGRGHHDHPAREHTGDQTLQRAWQEREGCAYQKT